MNNPTIEQLGQEAVQARREGRLADAYHSAEKAVALCREIGPKQSLVRALMFLGQIERDAARRESALIPYEEAAALSREVDEPLRIAHTLRHLGDLHCEMGRFDLAEGYYKESLGIYRKERVASPGDLANAVRGFALMKDAAGANEEAMVLWKEAGGLYKTLGIEEGVKECNTHLDN
jgi:tetratricopeptide (TPR) repeat protein